MGPTLLTATNQVFVFVSKWYHDPYGECRSPWPRDRFPVPKYRDVIDMIYSGQPYKYKSFDA